MVGMGGAEHHDNPGQGRVGAGAHVQWGSGQPGGVDADHCRSTCSKPCNALEQSAAAASGQFNVKREPWWQQLMRMSDESALQAACVLAVCIPGEPSVIAMKAGTALVWG